MKNKNVVTITGATVYYNKAAIKKKQLSFKITVTEDDLETMRTMIRDGHNADAIKLTFATNKGG